MADEINQQNQLQIPAKSDSFFTNLQSFKDQANSIAKISKCEKHNIAFAHNFECPLCCHENKQLQFDTNVYSNDALEKYIDEIKNRNSNEKKVHVDLD